MIVLSGVLVLAAIGLLIDGVFFAGGGSGWQIPVYASIAASAAAGALLWIGAYLRRGEYPETAETSAGTSAPSAGDRPHEALTEPGGPSTARRTAPPTGPPTRPPPPTPQTTAPPTTRSTVPQPVPAHPGEPAGGAVLVVPGGPHYHLAGCRRVDGGTAIPLDVAEARAAGYQPCDLCRPDALIAETGNDDEQVLAEELAAAGRSADPTGPAPGDAHAAADGVPVVLVRNYYHRPECRYVAVSTEGRQVTRGEARAHGAIPCGVCRP